jgi:hypothetical protein
MSQFGRQVFDTVIIGAGPSGMVMLRNILKDKRLEVDSLFLLVQDSYSCKKLSRSFLRMSW